MQRNLVLNPNKPRQDNVFFETEAIFKMSYFMEPCHISWNHNLIFIRELEHFINSIVLCTKLFAKQIFLS